MNSENKVLWFCIFSIMCILAVMTMGFGYRINKVDRQTRESASEISRLSSRVDGNATAIDYALSLCEQMRKLRDEEKPMDFKEWFEQRNGRDPFRRKR